MKNLKKVIIFMIILIVIIITFLCVILFTHKNENQTSEVGSSVENNNNELSSVKDESEYHDIERIINKYFGYVNYLDYDYFQVNLDNSKKQEAKEKYFEKGKEVLNDILVKQCTEKESWEKNLSKYIRKNTDIIEMKKSQYNNIDVYLITLSYDNDNSNIIVYIDSENQTFSVLPEEYLSTKIAEDNLFEIITKVDINHIEKNKNNLVQRITLDDERVCLQYYYNYLDKLKNNVDNLYNVLDKEYREKKFENIDLFKEYIDNNKQKLEKAVLSKFQVKKYNDYTEYTCVDEDGRYYVFCATAPMKYTLYLDTYTVNLPEFAKKYSTANEQERVILNVNKVMTAINEGNYNYFYSKLADSFKNNYFENEEKLKEYWLNNVFRKCTVEFEEFKREGNLFTYKLRLIKEYEEGEEIPFGKNAESKYVNIVMQLKEGTDFVMSFSML